MTSGDLIASSLLLDGRRRDHAGEHERRSEELGDSDDERTHLCFFYERREKSGAFLGVFGFSMWSRDLLDLEGELESGRAAYFRGLIFMKVVVRLVWKFVVPET